MNQEQLEQTNEISLVDLFKILRSNFWLIFILTAIFGILAAVYAFVLVNPKYKSEAYVLVQVQVESTTGSGFDLVNASRLLESAKELMAMPVVLTEVIENLGLDITPVQLQRNLSVKSSTTSYFINISYISEDPEEAKLIVNEVINEAIKFADANLLILEENIIRTSFAEDGVYDSPNKLLYTVIGLMLGGILGVGLAFLKEMFNNTFRTKEQLEAYFGIQVLGVIPEFEVKEIK
jgi:capsular polysaccharide biosynthesis protein